MTSLAHGPNHEACHADGTGCVIPGTRSVRPANRTRGPQHVEPRTYAHMGVRAFRILQTLTYILSVREVVLSQTWSVSGLDFLHADPREGRSQNARWTSYATSREAGAVLTIVPRGPFGLLHPSPIWFGPCVNSTHTFTRHFTHLTRAPRHTLRDNHIGGGS